MGQQTPQKGNKPIIFFFFLLCVLLLSSSYGTIKKLQQISKSPPHYHLNPFPPADARRPTWERERERKRGFKKCISSRIFMGFFLLSEWKMGYEIVFEKSLWFSAGWARSSRHVEFCSVPWNVSAAVHQDSRHVLLTPTAPTFSIYVQAPQSYTSAAPSHTSSFHLKFQAAGSFLICFVFLSLLFF